MDIKQLILKKIKEKGEVRVADIVKVTSFSRSYINRFFNELKDEGRIVLIGKANQARYIFSDKQLVNKAKERLVKVFKILKNNQLNEDEVLTDIKKNSGIFLDIRKNIARVVDYAFTEILNNAIEHSESKTIEVSIRKDSDMLVFSIFDHGIGIFNNLIKKKKLNNELEAIQDLTKGKLTTAPEAHSGEGIFFTSKVGDTFTIDSFGKKLIFNNILDDIFIKDVKIIKGTKVQFVISLNSKQSLEKLFKRYTDDSLSFDKTEVIVKLYKIDSEYISRSQARRVLSGLEKFKKIILDFKDVELVGQAFSDEVFRVWQNKYPSKKIAYRNANKNIKFMINRSLNV